MPELRKDSVTGRWVIISTERSKRPTDFGSVPHVVVKKNSHCPFCPGHESETPPEIMALRPDSSPPNSEGWTVRVVPNKFPALMVEGELTKSGEGMYDRMSGVGAHEVIIETNDHESSISKENPEQVEAVLRVFRSRIGDLRQDQRFQYILVFKNHGREAGASLDHPHCQLIALPIVPKRVLEEIEGALEYFNFKERCVYCDMVHQETTDRSRIIEENTDFISFEPFASRFPFETCIVPKRHNSHFFNIDDQQLTSLAKILQKTLEKLRLLLDDPPYNMVIHTGPLNEGPMQYYHWHIEIMPKLTSIAGFEWGTGFYINSTPPEEAADRLNSIL